MPALNRRSLRTLAGVGLIALAAGGARVVAQQGGGEGDNPLAQNLPLAVEQTEGCLGVEVAQTLTGKNVIFAWFENKEAALRWYWSDAHTSAMRFVGAEPGAAHEPMADVPDEGPILVIASIVPSGADGGALGLGVSQIAIELYAPLPGGAYVGGRFAPASVKVKGLTDFSEQPE